MPSLISIVDPLLIPERSIVLLLLPDCSGSRNLEATFTAKEELEINSKIYLRRNVNKFENDNADDYIELRI